MIFDPSLVDNPPEFFETDLYIPRYKPVAHGDWKIVLGSMVLAPSYWGPARLVREMPTLLRGADTWMSMSPMEIESCEIGVRLSFGNVLVMGLGMGWVAAAAAMRDEVTSVTIVELSDDVIALHRELNLFAQLPPAARAKLRIEQADAYHYLPEMEVDVLMPDIWLPLVNDDRVSEVRAMQSNVQAKAVYFWGQELEIARHARAAGRLLDTAGIAATITDFNLPLLGLDWPGYPSMLETAAERWMRDRWLGTL